MYQGHRVKFKVTGAKTFLCVSCLHMVRLRLKGNLVLSSILKTPVFVRGSTAPLETIVLYCTVLYCVRLLNKLTERDLRSQITQTHSVQIEQCVGYTRITSITVFVK